MTVPISPMSWNSGSHENPLSRSVRSHCSRMPRRFARTAACEMTIPFWSPVVPDDGWMNATGFTGPAGIGFPRAPSTAIARRSCIDSVSSAAVAPSVAIATRSNRFTRSASTAHQASEPGCPARPSGTGTAPRWLSP